MNRDALETEITGLAAETIAHARAAGLWLGTAESCTGGLVAAALTDIPGASEVMDCGIVTYSNRAKQALLGVPAEVLAEHGAVSEPCARAMAEGLRSGAGIDLTIAVTGIAGPGGGNQEKPVGLVWFAAAGPGGITTQVERFGDPGRARIRRLAVRTALMLLRAASV